MASMVEEVLSEVRKVSSRIDTVEKTVNDVAKNRMEAADIIRKLSGASPRAAMGFDGADTMSLVSVGNARQKALGMGNFLQHVAMANGVDLGHGNDRGQITKALEKMGSRPVQKTALAESSGFTGGYTVPIQFYGELLRLIAEEAFIASQAFMIPMQSRTIQIPALSQSSAVTGSSAFFGGITASWQPEAASINESDPVFRQIELVARDLVFITISSNQLLQDNAVALDTLLTTLFKEAMAWFKDYYALRGNGANQPLGILNAPSTLFESRATAGTVKLNDLANMVSKLLLQGWNKAFWVMHPSVMPELIQLTNGATNSPFLIWVNPAPPTEDGPICNKLPSRLFNFPIYWSEKVPALGTRGDVMLIDPSKYVIGDRLALQIDMSNQVLFRTNQMMWRIIARWDGQPWFNAPVTLNDGTYQMSNAVVLDT